MHHARTLVDDSYHRSPRHLITCADQRFKIPPSRFVERRRLESRSEEIAAAARKLFKRPANAIEQRAHEPWTEVRYGIPYRLLLRFSDIFAASQLKNATFDLHSLVTRTLPHPLTDSADQLRPETAGAFRRNVLTIAEHVRLRGGHVVLATVPYDPRAAGPGLAVFRVGIDEHNGILRELAGAEGFTLADVDAQGRRLNDGTHRFFSDLVHRSDEGEEKEVEFAAPDTFFSGVDSDERREWIEKALEKLPDHQRIPLVLYHFEDLPYEDIAKKLGVSLSKVKTDILRGREALAKVLVRSGASHEKFIS